MICIFHMHKHNAMVVIVMSQKIKTVSCKDALVKINDDTVALEMFEDKLQVFAGVLQEWG